MVTNYLREQNYKTITGVLHLITVYPDLIEQLCPLKVHQLPMKELRQMLDYFNSNPSHLYFFDLQSVMGVMGEYGEINIMATDELYLEYMNYLHNYMYTEPNNGKDILFCIDYLLTARESALSKKESLLTKGLLKHHINYFISDGVYREEIDLLVWYYQHYVQEESKLKSDLELIFSHY